MGCVTDNKFPTRALPLRDGNNHLFWTHLDHLLIRVRNANCGTDHCTPATSRVYSIFIPISDVQRHGPFDDSACEFPKRESLSMLREGIKDYERPPKIHYSPPQDAPGSLHQNFGWPGSKALQMHFKECCASEQNCLIVAPTIPRGFTTP